MKIEERSFNIYSGNRPRVILIGNGLNLSFGGISWDCLLDNIKDKTVFNRNSKDYDMPMPLKASMLTGNNLASKMRDIVKEDPANEEKICWKDFASIKEALAERLVTLIDGRYDYVLTTNYSYEIELALLRETEASRSKIAKLMNHHEVDNAQKQFLINTFNLAGSTPVWHIHGEARKPDSMIIGAAYYGKLIRRYVERIDGGIAAGGGKKPGHGKDYDYVNNFKNGKPQKIGSWIDALVLGDVDIIGYGLDFSESDIWWLIDYKATRNKTNPGMCGMTTFYTPDESGNKCCADTRVSWKECRNLILRNTYGVSVKGTEHIIRTKEDYPPFYDKIISELA